jgi:hypothetical protein
MTFCLPTIFSDLYSDKSGYYAGFQCCAASSTVVLVRAASWFAAIGCACARVCCRTSRCAVTCHCVHDVCIAFMHIVEVGCIKKPRIVVLFQLFVNNKLMHIQRLCANIKADRVA